MKSAMRWVLSLWIVGLLLLVGTMPLLAQGATGAIAGTVTDPDGALVPSGGDCGVEWERWGEEADE